MTNERWAVIKLGALGGADVIKTGPFGSQLRASEYVADGVPVVMPKDLAQSGINTAKIARVAAAKAARLAAFRVKTGDILLARRGEMGRCVRISSAEDGWLGGTGCLRIRPGCQIGSRFLLQVLRWPATVAWLADHAVGQTMRSLNTRILAALPLALPGRSEQKRIVALLESVDQTIAYARRVLEHTQRIWRESFRRLLTRGPGARFLERNSSSFEPRSWPLQAVGSLCRLSNGRGFRLAERSKTGLPIVRIQNLNGSRQFHYWAGQPRPQWTVEEGDLLFAWAGVKGSSFGPRLWPGPRGVLNQHIFRLEPKEGIVKSWLFEALKVVTVEIEGRAQGFKESLLHIRKRDFTEHLVPVPPPQVQRWIAEQSRALRGMECVEKSALAALIRLKQGLTDDLLSARVRTV